MFDTTEIFLTLLEYQNNLKLFHFQTPSYAAHKASDLLHAKFIVSLDQILEVLQGKKQSRIPQIKKANLTIRSYTDSEFIQYTSFIVQYLETQTGCSAASRSNTNSEICNILDTLRADLEQFVYLLSFK
jgi:5-carboxymethyl-2-hydroxymuconate isomerase